MLNLIKKLCNASGVSGSELEVSQIIIDEIKDYAEISRDRLGSIIAFKKGKNPAKTKLMLCAHMDEVGLIITTITEKGLLKFDTVGGIDPRVLAGRRVFAGKNRISGVIGVTAMHLLGSNELKNSPPVDKLYIDIGTSSKDETEKLVSIGDIAVFDSDFIEFGEGFIKAKAIDDRAGCAMLIEMIKAEQEYDLYFAFTVQEEVGSRGAKTAAFTIKPEAAIVLEATTAADIPFVDEHKRVCFVGQGPVISFMDKGTIYNRGMYELSAKIAVNADIPHQPKLAVAGGNDAASVHISGEGIKTLAISLPCRYLHTASCVIKYSDAVHSLNLATKLAEQIASQGIDEI
jgi:putative aminopeptidase FrvX